MIRLRARLPLNRQAEGEFWVEDQTGIIYGPVRCRGEADNANATKADNIIEDPARAGGDHPWGEYRVTGVVTIKADDPAYNTYGPYFIKLDPTGGEALEAKENGRSGLGIHGGRLHSDGRLRETFGCLRMEDGDVVIAGGLVRMELARGAEVVYVCEINDAS